MDFLTMGKNTKTKLRPVLVNAIALKVYSPYRGTETIDDPHKVLVPLTSVKRDAENARLHPDRNKRGIRASFKRWGQTQPIVVDRNGVVVIGNGRHEVAEELGWQFIWIQTTHLTGPEMRAMSINDNQTGLTSEWDSERLPAHLRDLRSWVPDGDDVVPFSDDDLGVFEESEPAGIYDDEETQTNDPDDKTSTKNPASTDSKPKRTREVKPPPPDADDRARNDLAINGITPNMRIVINQAFEKVRLVCADMSLTEGRCLELICADYLAGV